MIYYLRHRSIRCQHGALNYHSIGLYGAGRRSQASNCQPSDRWMDTSRFQPMGRDAKQTSDDPSITGDQNDEPEILTLISTFRHTSGREKKNNPRICPQSPPAVDTADFHRVPFIASTSALLLSPSRTTDLKTR